MKTISVVEILDGNLIGVASFPYTDEGREDAKKLAIEIVKDGCIPIQAEETFECFDGDIDKYCAFEPFVEDIDGVERADWKVIIAISQSKCPFSSSSVNYSS
jgi:hypothetical protein